MAHEEPPRPPILLCRLCREGIWAVQKFVLVGMGAAHVTCLERSADDDLTGVERSRVIRLCWDHPVAACEACRREYRITEMGNDMLTGRYYFCPYCRADLVWSVRQHIADCAVIHQSNPQWQAEVREALTRARETRKSSQQLRDASELTRIESEVLRDRVQDTTEAARQAKQDAERIKRSDPLATSRTGNIRCAYCQVLLIETEEASFDVPQQFQMRVLDPATNRVAIFCPTCGRETIANWTPPVTPRDPEGNADKGR